MTSIVCKFTEGTLLSYFQKPTTSFRLVFYVTERTSFPYFQYNSIYWFTIGIRASLLKEPRSRTSSNALSTSYRLVFYVNY
jgi:hypothetical protein